MNDAYETPESIDRKWSWICHVMFLIFGFLIGAIVVQAAHRHVAIEAGVGRYEIDATTGESRFVYGAGTAERSRAGGSTP